MQNQKGFIIPLIIAIVAAAVLGAAGYFAYQYFTKPETQNPKSEININVQNTNVQNETANYFEIKELGLEFKITDDIKDLVYLIKDYSPETNNRNVLFSTKSLAASGGTYCSVSEAPLGVLVISQKRSTGGEIAVSYLIESNNFYVSYIGPQAACSDIKSAQDLQTGQLNSLRESVKTITKTSN